jgi:putative NADH-flavin reductase
MRIVIFGANGPTGRLLTRLSLTAGYDTVAVTRQPGAFPLQDPRLRVAGADVLDADAVDGVVEGSDAVLSASASRSARRRSRSTRAAPSTCSTR